MFLYFFQKLDGSTALGFDHNRFHNFQKRKTETLFVGEGILGFKLFQIYSISFISLLWKESFEILNYLQLRFSACSLTENTKACKGLLKTNSSEFSLPKTYSIQSQTTETENEEQSTEVESQTKEKFSTTVMTKTTSAQLCSTERSFENDSSKLSLYGNRFAFFLSSLSDSKLDFA